MLEVADVAVERFVVDVGGVDGYLDVVVGGDVDFDFEDAVFDFLLRYDGERDCVAALAAVGRGSRPLFRW